MNIYVLFKWLNSVVLVFPLINIYTFELILMESKFWTHMWLPSRAEFYMLCPAGRREKQTNNNHLAKCPEHLQVLVKLYSRLWTERYVHFSLVLHSFSSLSEQTYLRMIHGYFHFFHPFDTFLFISMTPSTVVIMELFFCPWHSGKDHVKIC